jgi:hypothetical protein
MYKRAQTASHIRHDPSQIIKISDIYKNSQDNKSSKILATNTSVHPYSNNLVKIINISKRYSSIVTNRTHRGLPKSNRRKKEKIRREEKDRTRSSGSFRKRVGIS